MIFIIFIRYNESLFPLKLPHNLNGKAFKVGALVTEPFVCNRIGGGYAGLDIDIIEAMASALNFTIAYINAEDLRKDSDEKVTHWRNNYGLWKVLYLRALAGEIDVGIGRLTLRPDLVDDLGYTQPYLRNAVEFFVTQDLVLANEMKHWVAMVVIRMAVVHMCVSLAINLIKLAIKRGKRDFGATAIMVSRTMDWR